MKKKEIDENLQEFIIKYKSDFSNKHNTFNHVYNGIKSKYDTILEKYKKGKLEYIKKEKYRLENLKISIESNVNSISVAFLVVLISTTIILFDKFSSNLSFLVASLFCFVLFHYGKGFVKYVSYVRIYDIAIKVLDDIEKEEQERIKKETDEKAGQKLIEQVVNIKCLINDIAQLLKHR